MKCLDLDHNIDTNVTEGFPIRVRRGLCTRDRKLMRMRDTAMVTEVVIRYYATHCVEFWYLAVLVVVTVNRNKILNRIKESHNN